MVVVVGRGVRGESGWRGEELEGRGRRWLIALAVVFGVQSLEWLPPTGHH